MAIFSKKKQSADELPRSGCMSITGEQYNRVCDSEFADIECDSGREEFFYYGFVAGLSFVSCPKGAEMHGVGAYDYARNAFLLTYRDAITEDFDETLEAFLLNWGISAKVEVLLKDELGQAEGGDV